LHETGKIKLFATGHVWNCKFVVLYKKKVLYPQDRNEEKHQSLPGKSDDDKMECEVGMLNEGRCPVLQMGDRTKCHRNFTLLEKFIAPCPSGSSFGDIPFG
jgi:hypothetical protein